MRVNVPKKAPMSQSKEQWIEKTGGFRFLESNEDFQRRVAQIEKIEKKIKRGKATATDINELAKLKGTGESDEEL